MEREGVNDGSGSCTECGRVLLWAGTSGYLPHPPVYHERWRKFLLTGIATTARWWITASGG